MAWLGRALFVLLVLVACGGADGRCSGLFQSTSTVAPATPTPVLTPAQIVDHWLANHKDEIADSFAEAMLPRWIRESRYGLDESPVSEDEKVYLVREVRRLLEVDFDKSRDGSFPFPVKATATVDVETLLGHAVMGIEHWMPTALVGTLTARSTYILYMGAEGLVWKEQFGVIVSADVEFR